MQHDTLKAIVPDEFVTPMKIAEYLDRPVEDLYKMKFFDDIPYKVNYWSHKTYKYDNCMRKISAANLDPPTKTHPFAKLRKADIMADLGIQDQKYKSLVDAGLLKVQPADRFGKFVYYRDYEHFLKNYVPTKMLEYLPKTMNLRDSAVFLETTPASLRAHCARGHLDIVYWVHTKTGRKRFKWITKENLIQFANWQLNEYQRKAHKIVRKTPWPDKMSTALASVYMKVSDRALRMAPLSELLHPEQVKVGRRKNHVRNLYSKEELDRVYNLMADRKYYNEGRIYYSRQAIRNKFNKSEYWIDNLIDGKCRVVVSLGARTTRTPNEFLILTPEEYVEKNAEVAKTKGWIACPMMGWLQEDVDAVIASGANVDPKFEISDYRKKHMDSLDKTNKWEEKRKRHKAAKAGAKTRHKRTLERVIETPVFDEVELALKAALHENELRAEQRHKEAYARQYEKTRERNQMRKLLGLDEQDKISIDNKTILQESTTPCVVTILYRRKTGNAPILYKQAMGHRDEVVFVTSDKQFRMRRNRNPQMSIFLNIGRTVQTVLNCKPRVTPSWIVLAHTSSSVYDPSFIEKLNEVPPEIGAVAPFGYEYTLPDGTWLRCPNTYGMYSEFSANNSLYSKRVAGTVSVTGSHEVAVLDGPFVAVRGGYLSCLRDFSKLYTLGDGRGCVPYVVSMMMHRLGVKVMQIEVDSSWCRDVNFPFTQMEWNLLEPKLITIGKLLVSDDELNLK